MEKNNKKIKSALVVVVFLFLAFVAFLVFVFNKGGFKEDNNNSPKKYGEIDFTNSDASSLEFALNGHVMTFPVSFEELASAGYKPRSEDANQSVAEAKSFGYQEVLGTLESDFNSKLSVWVANFDEFPHAYNKCTIVSISADDDYFVLCNGINLSSSYQDVISTMGEPDEYDDGPTGKNLTYTYNTSKGKFEIFITFSESSGTEKMDTLAIYDKSR